MLTFKIDGKTVECPEGKTILEAADLTGIYIPRLCHHPDLPQINEAALTNVIYQNENKIVGDKSSDIVGRDGHCNLCYVQIGGAPEPVNSCITIAEEGMVVQTDTTDVIDLRKQALSKILATHPHACLTCAQKQGCSRTDCSSNVPVDERCCRLLGNCELEKISDYIGIPGDTPKYIPKKFPVVKNDPLFERDYNLCIACLRCVRICNDVREANVMGASRKDDRIWVGTLKKGSLPEAECRFCGACVEVCPTGALLDKENVPQVNRDSALPCVGGCPAGIDIPHYLKLISLGRYGDALDVIRLSVPFPGILGYVCFHPCEDNCRRADIDQAVAICDLKRFVADKVPIDDTLDEKKLPDSGKKAAVIGSGPAGLTAAYYLRILGHQVDLYDENEKPGGMLRQGIPAYRLPDEVLDREISTLEKLGINFKMNQPIGNEFGIPKLKSDGYNAILIAAGVSSGKSLNIENSDLDGIYFGLEFLKSAKLDQKPVLSGRVVVIGGGNVAIDAAMTALRQGAGSVQLVCLESRDEMPAHSWEIQQAEEEGIEIVNSWGPNRFEADNGRVSAIELKKCLRVFDEQGRFHPQYDENDTKIMKADFVLITIGQEINRGLTNHLKSLQDDSENILGVDNNFSTGIEDVFAAGDIVNGPSSVIEAIAAGRKSAEAIDKHLGGAGLAKVATDSIIPNYFKLDSEPESLRRPRQHAKTADPKKRKTEFCLIEETFDEKAAKHEALRCLQCHLRQQISPIILPPEQWLPLIKESVEYVPAIEGVFQLLDADKKTIRIMGTINLRQELELCLDNPGEAKYFLWEEDPMFTKRESELIQQYLQSHGELPGGGMGDDLDDLF